MKVKQICETLHEMNVFDFIDATPTVAGLIVAILAIMTAMFVLLLDLLKDVKHMKGPFDGY